MILAIDCGNSRLKWGCCTPLEARAGSRIDWIERGVLDIEQISSLSQQWNFTEQPSAIMVSNVAGRDIAARLEQVLSRFHVVPCWITPSAAEHGVINGYADAASLGVDRWLALIGAQALHSGDCLVVMAGTATTVDVLRANGEFCGGLILPGMKLMKQALARHTAGLELGDGAVSDTPRNTADAIESGCLFAQTGAIERMFGRLSQNGLCVISGGASIQIAEHLNIRHLVVDNLVLEGLVRAAPQLQGR